MHAIDRIYTQYPFYGVRRFSRRCGTKATRSSINGCIGMRAWGCRRSIRETSPGLSLSVAGSGDGSTRSGLGFGHHYLPLLDGFVYLVPSIGSVAMLFLAHDPRRGVLSGGAGGGPDPGPALQHRSAIHLQPISPSAYEGAGVRMSVDGRGRCMDNVSSSACGVRSVLRDRRADHRGRIGILTSITRSVFTVGLKDRPSTDI